MVREQSNLDCDEYDYFTFAKFYSVSASFYCVPSSRPLRPSSTFLEVKLPCYGVRPKLDYNFRTILINEARMKERRTILDFINRCRKR